MKSRLIPTGIAFLMVMALIVTVPSKAMAIDTTSTSGVRIVTVPVGASTSAVAMVGDAIALQHGSRPGGLWPGSGLLIRFSDDGLLAGANISVKDMNDRGEIVGGYSLNGVQKAFVWSEANGATDIPAPPGLVADSPIFEATGISDDGWIVGIYRAEAGTCGFAAVNPCGFLAIPNGSGFDVSTFLQPTDQYAYFGAEDIELVTIGGVSAHVAVGFGLVWSDADPADPWRLLDKGSTPLTTSVDAVDVNRNGEIVGRHLTSGSVMGAAYWSSPVAPLTALGALPGDARSEAFAINDAGTIVGFSGASASLGTAVYWTGFAPGANDLGHIADGTAFSAARGINEDGIIVGESAGDAVIWDVGGDYEVGSVIEIDPIGDQTVTAGDVIFFTVTSTGAPSSGYLLSSGQPPDLTDPPAGAFLASDTGNFIWPTTADDVGVHVLTVSAFTTDPSVPPGTATFTITIEPYGVLPPVVVEVAEAVGVTETIAVRPPVNISISEPVAVADDVAVRPPVLIHISEDVAVTDVLVLTPELVIRIVESVAVDDQVSATAVLGSIAGVIWEDANGDGNRDLGELSQSDVTVFLDSNDNGTLDSGEPSTATGATGTYLFPDLVPGSYVVRQIPPSGFSQTYPSILVDPAHRVNVSSGPFAGLDFGNRQTPNLPPVIEPIDDVVVDVGQFIEIRPVIFDPEGDPYTHEWDGTPPTADINGVIPYLPPIEDAGLTFFVTLTVTQIDNPANVAIETFTITVNPVDQPATVAPIEDAFGLPGQRLVIVPEVEDLDGDPYSLLWEGGPPNALLNGIFVLTPTAAEAGDVYPITLSVLQGGQVVDTEEFLIFIGGESGSPNGVPDVTPAVVDPGSPITIGGGGFDPGSQVGAFLFSDPVLLGVADVGDDEAFSVEVTIPAGTTPGVHTIVVMGSAPDRTRRTLQATIEVLPDPDPDDDGLTTDEELLTGTDPAKSDSDGDGLIDGLDASWLLDYLDGVPLSQFDRRFHKAAMKLTVFAAAVAVNFGDADTALAITSTLHRRIDGCGSTPDRNDWMTGCASQVAFRELLGLYERNISTLPLPGRYGRQ